MSQAALAKRLNVSAMAPSRWERGINQPPASVYIQLGKLAGRSPNRWYFWERAGIRKSDLQKILDGANDKSGGTDLPRIEVLSYGKKAKSHHGGDGQDENSNGHGHSHSDGHGHSHGGGHGHRHGND